MNFYKISREQYEKDCQEFTGVIGYDEIKLPKRATKYSAGYDFYSTKNISLAPGKSVKLPTGIKVELDTDKFLMVVPRSGLGFKYRLQLDNTCGIIDADYINAENEGHIWVKITNDSRENKSLLIKAGDAICQGIILKYFTTEDDDSNNIRHGGFGSTDGK